MAKTQEEQFTDYCDKIAEKADDNELYMQAVIRVAAQIIYEKYGDEHLAQDLIDLLPVEHPADKDETSDW